MIGQAHLYTCSHSPAGTAHTHGGFSIYCLRQIYAREGSTPKRHQSQHVHRRCNTWLRSQHLIAPCSAVLQRCRLHQKPHILIVQMSIAHPRCHTDVSMDNPASSVASKLHTQFSIIMTPGFSFVQERIEEKRRSSLHAADQ